MKFLLTLGKTVVFFLLAILSYWYWYSHGLYNTGESDKFKLRVGQTVFFKLDHNGSTGYSEFWANDSLAKCVILDHTNYHRPVWNWFKNGVGGMKTYYFKATQPGTDTVKMVTASPAYFHPEGYGYKDTPILINTFVFEVE